MPGTFDEGAFDEGVFDYGKGERGVLVLGLGGSTVRLELKPLATVELTIPAIADLDLELVLAG